MSYSVSSFGLSDVGLVRQRNEDLWASLEEKNLFILADGMGGHQAGDIAAKISVETLLALTQYQFEEGGSQQERANQLEELFQQVNVTVYREAIANPHLFGMGTTLCCLHFYERRAIWAHVGDSRIYRFRSQQLEQLTVDDTLLRQMIDEGEIQEGEGRQLGYKNVITKAIGTEPTIAPTVESEPVEVGDRYLLCSDGLSDLLSRREIEVILREHKDIQSAAHALIETAKEHGGYDNITVLLVAIDPQK